MSYFKGKRILLFAPNFFGYEKDITSKLVEMGAAVDFFDERPSNKSIFKAALRLNAKSMAIAVNNYYRKIMEQLNGKNFDYVFVVNAEAITTEIVDALRSRFRNARFVLYMWDSVRNKKNTISLISHFDSVYSFDRFDAESMNGVCFKPLFYTDDYKPCYAPIKYDLVFAGTAHADRFMIVEKFKAFAKSNNISFHTFLYLHSPLMYYYQKFSDKSFRTAASIDDFSFKKMSKTGLIEIMCAGKAVLDIQHPNQTGLTMRTFEVMALQKKLITTNQDIVNYDFYRPENVYVIDRNAPYIETGFFDKAFAHLEPQLLYQYSIESWLKTLLD